MVQGRLGLRVRAAVWVEFVSHQARLPVAKFEGRIPNDDVPTSSPMRSEHPLHNSTNE